MVSPSLLRALVGAGGMLLWAAPLGLGAAVPAWWSAFPKVAILESRFRQQSESLVFGKLTREGSLVLARGGRLWVAYDGGLTVTCDGTRLVQVDPDTRTAQQMLLAQALQEFPVLNLLLDPAKAEALYRVEAQGGDAVRLVPRGPGLPTLKATGRRGLLQSLSWTDASGALQTIELLDPRTPGKVSPSRFKAQLPPGTRWATPNG